MFVWIGHQQAIDMGEALDNFVADKPNSPLKHQPYRSIGVGSQILRYLGVRDMRLLSSPLKFNALSGFDLNLVETVANPDHKYQFTRQKKPRALQLVAFLTILVTVKPYDFLTRQVVGVDHQKSVACFCRFGQKIQ